MTTGEMLADQIRRTREWTLKLVECLEDEDWTYQARPGLQHALWICGHVAVAQELLVFQRCLGTSRLDSEFRGHFTIGGPVKSAQDYGWPRPALVREKMREVQAASEEAVTGMSEALLAEPAFGKDGARHPHYDTKRGAICHVVRHEAFHAGQLAMILRLRGKPFLR